MVDPLVVEAVREWHKAYEAVRDAERQRARSVDRRPRDAANRRMEQGIWQAVQRHAPASFLASMDWERRELFCEFARDLVGRDLGHDGEASVADDPDKVRASISSRFRGSDVEEDSGILM